MPQIHYVQHGTFHLISNTKGRQLMLTIPGIPELLMDNLSMTRNVQGAKLFAFCILPDHIHILIQSGEKGLSKFMHSFKKNSARDINNYLGRGDCRIAPTYKDIHNNQNHDLEEVRSKHRNSDCRIAAAFSCATAKPFTWQKGYYDERVQSSEQRSAALHYVRNNALRHDIVSDIDEWPWSSIHYPELMDEMEIWY